MRHDELRARVAEIRWHHSIDLGQGIVTPGQDNSPRKLARLKLPESLSGKTVLDVGAWDGYFSFEAERRGAQRVLATDSYCWDGSHDWGSKRGFDLAREALGSKVEAQVIDVLDLAPERVGVFDVVLFLGVLYHMRHPLLALERVAGVARDLLILETAVDLLKVRQPALAFYPRDEMCKDHTNWCGPNPKAVVAMLETVGFRKIQIISGTRSWWFRYARAVYNRWKRGLSFADLARTDRIVVHAWKQ